MIIAIGFKIENERAIQFRKWVNRIVKEYMIQCGLLCTYRFSINSFMSLAGHKYSLYFMSFVVTGLSFS